VNTVISKFYKYISLPCTWFHNESQMASHLLSHTGITHLSGSVRILTNQLVDCVLASHVYILSSCLALLGTGLQLISTCTY